jgi:hypothetical protein
MELEALIVQNQKNNQETNDNLEALIVQTQKNDNKDELEAIAKANLDTKNVIKSGNKDIIKSINNLEKAVKDIKFPEAKEEISIKNDITKNVVDELVNIKNELNKEQKVNITLELI